MAPYLKSDTIFTCPEEPREFYQAGCPANKNEDEFTYHFDGGYIFNSLSTGTGYINRNRIRRPSQYVFVLDGEPSIGFTAMNPGSEPATLGDLETIGVKLRHRDRANTLFADGHVKSLSVQELGDRTLWSLTGRLD